MERPLNRVVISDYSETSDNAEGTTEDEKSLGGRGETLCRSSCCPTERGAADSCSIRCWHL